MIGVSFITGQARQGKVVVLYGDGGTLKSTTAAAFPRAICGQYALRGGVTRLIERGVRVANIATLAELQDFSKACVDPRNQAEFDTVILDDIDLLIDDVIREAKSKNPKNKYDPFTRTYDAVIPVLHRLIGLKFNGKHIVITLGKKAGVESVAGADERVLVQPNLPKKLLEDVVRNADVVAFCAAFPDGSVRALTRERASEARRTVAKCTAGIGLAEVLALSADGVGELVEKVTSGK